MTDASRIPAERGTPIGFEFDDEAIEAFEGETVAAALLAANVEAFGVTRNGGPRLPLCNMGTCFDCVVTIDGEPLMRSCLTDARDGMKIQKYEAQ